MRLELDINENDVVDDKWGVARLPYSWGELTSHESTRDVIEMHMLKL